MQLEIFLDAQHFLETEDEWAMAIVPVIQEFGATEMRKTTEAEDELDHDLSFSLDMVVHRLGRLV
jgi:hypothetical protein